MRLAFNFVNYLLTSKYRLPSTINSDSIGVSTSNLRFQDLSTITLSPSIGNFPFGQIVASLQTLSIISSGTSGSTTTQFVLKN